MNFSGKVEVKYTLKSRQSMREKMKPYTKEILHDIVAIVAYAAVTIFAVVGLVQIIAEEGNPVIGIGFGATVVIAGIFTGLVSYGFYIRVKSGPPAPVERYIAGE